MVKTNFINGNPLQGIQGTVVTAEFLNAINSHVHDGLNEDGHVSKVLSQWDKPSLTFTYVSTTSFKVNGDQTDIYKSVRRLKINLSASTVYSEVVSASYASNETTIIILDAVLNATLVDVEHSLFLPRKDNGAISIKMVTADGGEINVFDSIINKTADYTLVAADLTGRKKFTNSDAAGTVAFILPAAAVSYRTAVKIIENQIVNIISEVTDSIFIGGTTLSPYTIGTISVSNGSPTVTGVGTTWTTNAKAGDSFRGNGGGLYIIQSVDSNTQITLTSNHNGALSGVSYGIGKSVACKAVGFEFIIESYAANKWTIRGVGVQPEIKVRKNTNQLNLTNDANILILWENEIVDNNNNFTSNTATLTVPGSYLFIVTLCIKGLYLNANIRVHTQIWKNAALFQGKSDFIYTGASYDEDTGVLVLKDISNGRDTYTVYCRVGGTDSSADVAVNDNNSAGYTQWEIIRLSD